jgi:hypothetical protein
VRERLSISAHEKIDTIVGDFIQCHMRQIYIPRVFCILHLPSGRSLAFVSKPRDP